MSKVKILLLSANPHDQEYLKVGKEYKEIQRIIESEPLLKDLVDIIFEHDVQPLQLSDLLSKHKPHIIHFTGHGENTEIVFINEQGNSEPIDKKLLTDLIDELRHNIQIVFLNACGTDFQAKALAEVVGCSIGIIKNIRDEPAIMFAGSFYKLLASGYSIKKAFDVSKINLQLAGYKEEATYYMLHAATNCNPSEIYLVTPYKSRPIISAPKIWNNYVTILAFAKSIHHVYQTLDIHYLSEFITQLDEIQNKPDLQKVHRFIKLWNIYNDEFNEFSKELGNKFPENVVADAFDMLLNIKEIKIKQKLEDANKTYHKTIKERLIGYSKIHELASDLINKGDSITTLTNTDMANKVASRIIDLEKFARSLLVESDNLLRSLIEVLLQE